MFEPTDQPEMICPIEQQEGDDLFDDSMTIVIEMRIRDVLSGTLRVGQGKPVFEPEECPRPPIDEEGQRRYDKKKKAYEAARVREKKLRRRGWIR